MHEKNAAEMLALALDPCRMLAALGFAADPWQKELLGSTAPAILLNCSRGAGKSRTVSILALHTALFQPSSLVLLISRSQRQSGELYRYVKQAYSALGRPVPAVKETETQMELQNGSRIVSLPGNEETIRSYQAVNLLVLDEAARIPDELYASVSPMTGVSRGRTICLSTPFGQHGWFYREWHNRKSSWQRFLVPWQSCPRLSAAFIEEERRKFGSAWIQQEYECSFTAMEGLVYPNFEQLTAVGEPVPEPGVNDSSRRVGGLDFGFRNPFAAIWGHVVDDVLFITDEIYVRQTPLPSIIPLLPRDVYWSADPAGASDISQLRLASFKVFKANNDIRAGIAAVTARLQSGRLKIIAHRCPNLIAEARLYRYPEEMSGVRGPESGVEDPVSDVLTPDTGLRTPDVLQSCSEVPVDQNNHALGALRYLIARLDAAHVARYRRSPMARGAGITLPTDDIQEPGDLASNPFIWRPC
jgi:Terminase large subunit, T4likevirus-type, N-terminal